MLRSVFMAAMWAALAASAPAGATPDAATSDAARPDGVRETARTVKVSGLWLGMPRAELQASLVAQGFEEVDDWRDIYVENEGEVRQRVAYRSARGLDGPRVYEIDHSAYYPEQGFDADAVEREMRERFGEPSLTNQVTGRLELIYLEDPDAPKLGDVVDACVAELREKDPELTELLAETRARVACQYRPENDRVEALCPSVVPMYRRFAAAVEAPRMLIGIWPEQARVDTRLAWALLQLPFRGTPAPRPPRGVNATRADR